MRLALIAPLAAVIAGCAATPPAQSEQRIVDVTVTYRERILLPPGHTLKVILADVSLADAPSRTLAEATIELEGRGPPYAVQLSTPAADLDPRHEYAVRAEIRDPAGALRFTTDTRHSVLTRSAPDRADIVLVGVSAP
mgnify:CR=1 FL=1